MWNRHRLRFVGLLAAVVATSASPQPPPTGAERPEGNQWDKVFSRPEPGYRTEPNAFLTSAIERIRREQLLPCPPTATRFRPNQLVQAFADWRILDYEDGRFECDWAPGPPTHVVRLMARKPARRMPQESRRSTPRRSTPMRTLRRRHMAPMKLTNTPCWS